MYTCASCMVRARRHGDQENLPENCPIREEKFVNQVLEKYHESENQDFYVTSSAIETLGCGEWPRTVWLLCKTAEDGRLI